MRVLVKYMLCLLMCAAVLAASGCILAGENGEFQGSAPSEQIVDVDRLAKEGYAKLEHTRNLLMERMPAEYALEIPAPAGYNAPADGKTTAESVDRWLFDQQMLMLTPAIEALIAEESALCEAVVGEERAEAVNAAEQAVLELVASSSDLPGVYACVAGAENEIFSRVGTVCSADNTANFAVMPDFETADDGRSLLTLYTNFPLPGFEDSTYGYLLRLVLDGGDTEQVVADSLCEYEHISYGSSYAVTFDISSILKNSSPEQFFSGRNRVTFTFFARDNSFSWSEEYYKMRCADGRFTAIDEHRRTLSEIILEAL